MNWGTRTQWNLLGEKEKKKGKRRKKMKGIFHLPYIWCPKKNKKNEEDKLKDEVELHKFHHLNPSLSLFCFGKREKKEEGKKHVAEIMKILNIKLKLHIKVFLDRTTLI